MSHTCHATGCPVRVPPEMLMCKRHWMMLPRHVRTEIWRTYRPGQCDDWRISHAYAEAARAAVRFIAAKEGVEPDVLVYDMLDPKRYEEERSDADASEEVSSAAPRRRGPVPVRRTKPRSHSA